jgi:hypothetical protein
MMMLRVSRAQKCEFAYANGLYLSDYQSSEPIAKKRKKSLCLPLLLLLAGGESFDYYFPLRLFTMLFNRRSAASTSIL